MADIFRSKEVYKKLKHDFHDKNEIIQVRGVYVSGEYRPPYYNEAGIHITDISSIPAKIVDFQDATITTGEDTMLKVLDFSVVDVNPITLTTYTTESTSIEDGILKILDFCVKPVQPDILLYESKNQSTGEDVVVKVIDFNVIQQSIEVIDYPLIYKESTPEHTLRLTSISTEKATIENFIPQ